MLTERQKIYLVFKRAIDIFGSLLGLLVLSPLFLIGAAGTKVSSRGPVFFRQKRLGRNKKPFTLYKFRSMKYDAAQVGAESLTEEEQEKMVTPWGRFIRATSLDEIPQLVNILKGDMSFIGPRPNMVEHSEALIAARDSFVPSAYVVKPGLSGLAQIYLKRNPDIVKKSEYDSKYVQKFSFWLDFKLFILSLLVLFGFNKGK
jgi:lipopolysaccharide/colanic/teichoic acid biosynthesis glycosyltransferase